MPDSNAAAHDWRLGLPITAVPPASEQRRRRNTLRYEESRGCGACLANHREHTQSKLPPVGFAVKGAPCFVTTGMSASRTPVPPPAAAVRPLQSATPPEILQHGEMCSRRGPRALRAGGRGDGAHELGG